jgi:hypothetical protein
MSHGLSLATHDCNPAPFPEALKASNAAQFLVIMILATGVSGSGSGPSNW